MFCKIVRYPLNLCKTKKVKMKFIKKECVTIYGTKSNQGKWFAKISLLAFSVSLFLSLFSETILHRANFFIAFILLAIFMFANIFSDMVGLAITSCQIEKLKKENLTKRQLNICVKLIESSDKVSSILCDVVGDICGILCGVSGTIIAMILSTKIELSTIKIFIGAFTSSIVAGLTVLFKAISKNYAVKHSSKIVKKVSNLILFFKIFSRKNKK